MSVGARPALRREVIEFSSSLYRGVIKIRPKSSPRSHSQQRSLARGRYIFRSVMTALAVLGASGIVHAQENQQDEKPEINIHRSILSPVTPDEITPPEGNTAFVLGHGVGTQGYVCLPTATGGVF